MTVLLSFEEKTDDARLAHNRDTVPLRVRYMKSSTFELSLSPLLSHSPSVKDPFQHFNVFCHNSLKKAWRLLWNFH